MASLSDKAYELREIYKQKFKEYPRGWCSGEETMKEYEEYLSNRINND